MVNVLMMIRVKTKVLAQKTKSVLKRNLIKLVVTKKKRCLVCQKCSGMTKEECAAMCEEKGCSEEEKAKCMAQFDESEDNIE